MPAQRPRASFDPIPPDLDLDALVESTPNFQYVDRISCDMIDQQGFEAFDKLVLLHVVVGGKPLVIDGYQSRLDPWTFSSKWLQDNHGEKVEQARDLRKDYLYTPLTIGHYLRNMGKLAEQYYEKSDAHKELNRQRVYLKDIDCPDVWQDKLREHLPPNLFYLNESCGELGGPGSVDENGPTGGKRKGRGIAGAGDLMSSLPVPMRAQNLMCYIGHEGTYTPAHREMCATMGHNIMVEVSDVVGDEGKPERPGSSIWFMTESKDRQTVSEYWLSILGHDIEVEKHFAQIAAWKRAPFTTYVVEQKAGDFILIPPMAPHQVWNRGTRTMKVAWNRTTVETLDMAMKEALPNARMVCRDEQYKNKAIIYYSLQKYSALLAKARDQQQTAPSPQAAAALRTSPKIRQLQKDFKRLFHMFKQVLLSEMFSPDTPHERNVEFSPFDSNITCAYCRGNIFNRFLTCKTCDDLLGTTEPEPYDVCMDCYAMGRSCGCISKLRWAEQFKWKELLQRYELWRRQYVDLDGGVQKPESPLPLQEERARLLKKTLAQICQEQLKRRPWFDVHKPEKDDEGDSADEEIEINDDGTVKKKKKKRSEAWLKNHHACHVCCHRHEKWKMAECACGRHWCYGTLFRGYDQMPQQIMEDANWTCPHCKGICFAGNCRKDPRQKPYEPKGTLLGHDTRKVADARSVESLVDFGVSNLNFLKETVEAPADSARLRKRQEEAERAKLDSTTLDQHYATDSEDNENHTEAIEYSPDRSAIDPRLGGDVSIIGATRRLNETSGSHIAALLNEDLADAGPHLDGYQPAQPSGYVAPAAIMFNAPDAEGDEDDFTSYAELDGLGADQYATNGVGKRRKRVSDSGDGIKRAPPKKARRPEDRESLPGATKQYRKEQERKALEEARKAGRFIQTTAALRGRSRMIKLKIGRANMARIAAAEAEKEVGNDLLKSDVKPPEPPKARPLAANADKPSKAVRIRVERDDDFEARSRRRDRDRKSGAGGPPTTKRASEMNYEELEIDSDLEDSHQDDFGIAQLDGALETTETGGKKRRASAWQAKRLQGEDEEVLDALPDDYKDRGRNRNRSLPKKPAGKTVILRPSELSNTTVDPDALEQEPLQSQEMQINTAAAALQGLVDDEDNDDDEEAGASDEEMGVKAVATSLSSKNGMSILGRKGPVGKKVKIVGSKSKRHTTGNEHTVAGSSGWVAVNTMPKSSVMRR